MFDKVVKGCLNYVTGTYKEVDIEIPTFYNTDLSIIDEYTRSLQLRLLYNSSEQSALLAKLN